MTPLRPLTPDAVRSRSVSRPIVVAVSTGGSQAAVRHGAALAARVGAPLHVLHVVDLQPDGGPDHQLSLDRAARRGARVLAEAVGFARGIVAESVHISSELAHGDVADRIVTAGTAALCVVLQQAARPAGPGGRARVGPLVAVRIPSPMICVPGRATGRTGIVTVAVKDPLTAAAIVRESAVFAAVTGARLRLLHVVSPGSAQAEETVRSLDTLLDGLPVVGENSWVDLVEGTPAGVLRQAALTSELLVVGRHHPHRSGGCTVGPVARALIQRASCPVLLPTPSHSVSSAEWVFQTRWA